MLVGAHTNSLFCMLVSGCRDRAMEFVSAETIRTGAHRQGVLVDD
jgi:hypothetical protein